MRELICRQLVIIRTIFTGVGVIAVNLGAKDCRNCT